jgi:hypothetical protein
MTQPTRKIFISYRQTDHPEVADRVRAAVLKRYGADSAITGVGTFPPFARFEKIIGERVAESDAMLVLIGPEWAKLMKAQAGENDLVRIALEAALSRNEFIIAPVCYHGASIPSALDLPESLRVLSGVNAASIDPGRALDEEIERVLADFDTAFNQANAERRAAIRCNFCYKHHSQVIRLIEGPNNAYICNECIELCVHILADAGVKINLP